MQISKSNILIFAMIFLLLTVSCNTNVETNRIKARVSLVSVNNSEITVSVFPEDSTTGNIVTGALVLIKDSANSVTVLDFDNNLQCYTTKLTNSLDNEQLTLTIKSLLCKEISIQVPHQKLNNKPIISTFEDSNGNSVLLGNDLDSSLSIQIAWQNLGRDIVYKVTIQNGLNTVFLKSTQSTDLLIPKGTLAKGDSYYISITASYIKGDPFFTTEKYYSTSSIKSSGISFNVQ